MDARPEYTARTDAPPAILPLVLDRIGFEAGGKRLIKDLSLQLDAGPLTVVLGPNGAGKSLLLRLCHGLLRPASGTIAWGGLPPAAARRHQAMVFQRPVLLRRSAAGNIAYALAAKGVPHHERAALVDAALDRAGLNRLRDRPARVLSGGEQQRLALARALALKPQVLLLDEPTSNLDVAATAAVEDLVGLIRAGGTKVIMTTHDLGQARRLADEILFLDRGRLLEHAPAEAFFRGPTSPAAAAFIEGRLFKFARGG